jgi:hypothetical protein
MKSVYIYHHLGLGDHIMNNGLVRTIYEKYDKTFLFVKPKNFDNVNRMFRDLKNLRLIPFDDGQVRTFMSIAPDNNYVIAGHENFWKIFNDPSNEMGIDEIFYHIAGVPIENKWSKFYIERDSEKEEKVFYDLFELKDDEEFIFLHESEKTTEIPITKEIPKGIKIIRPDNLSVSIFDYMYLIEKAKEVHVMNSSFMNLIDSSQLRKDGLFYHEYSRPGSNTAFKLPWKILK